MSGIELFPVLLSEYTYCCPRPASVFQTHYMHIIWQVTNYNALVFMGHYDPWSTEGCISSVSGTLGANLVKTMISWCILDNKLKLLEHRESTEEQLQCFYIWIVLFYDKWQWQTVYYSDTVVHITQQTYTLLTMKR